MAEVFYFEDIIVGVSQETPGRTLTEADLVRYVGLTGDREHQTADAESAGLSGVDVREMPDLLPLCVSSGLTCRIAQPPLAILAFVSLEWQFLKRVRVGDTVRCGLRSLAKRRMKESGAVIQEHTVINQHDQIVQRGKVTLLVASRAAP